MRRSLQWGLSCLLLLFLISCREEVYMPVNGKKALSIPEYFPEAHGLNASIYPTEYGTELGRKLFYDGRLAADNTVACAFCHIQENAFTHHGHTVSHGVEDRQGFRNAPPLQNLIFLTSYMWDGVVKDLEKQPVIPISAHEEMDETMENIVKKISSDPEYQKLFYQTFGDKQIKADRILNALAQFMTTLISANSRYDAYLSGKGTLTEQERYGMEIFTAKCGSCHSGALLTDQSFRNTGLPENPLYKDIGRARYTGNASDKYAFRVPSLRNLSYTAPYMHDGRFSSLQAVLDFYDSGVKNVPNLDPELKKHNGKTGIPLLAYEKSAILAFLKTLDDPTFISNPHFSGR